MLSLLDCGDSIGVGAECRRRAIFLQLRLVRVPVHWKSVFIAGPIDVALYRADAFSLIGASGRCRDKGMAVRTTAPSGDADQIPSCNLMSARLDHAAFEAFQSRAIVVLETAGPSLAQSGHAINQCVRGRRDRAVSTIVYPSDSNYRLYSDRAARRLRRQQGTRMNATSPPPWRVFVQY